jgi:hypothetical protein
MTKVWYCSTCGYEVGFRGRCHQCGQRLEQSPLPELEPGAEEDEVGYRLDDWADEARGRMIVELIDAGIAHRFEDDELVIEVADEEQVDQLVSRLTGAAVADGGVGRDDPDDSDYDDSDYDESVIDDEHLDEPSEWGRPTTEVIQLEAAAARLSLDPTDMEADGEVAEASTAVFVVDDPPWADVDTWAAVGRVTRRLMAALGAEDALEEEIRTQAGILARLLAPIVRQETAADPDVPATTTGEPPATDNGPEADIAPAADNGLAADGGRVTEEGLVSAEGPAPEEGLVSAEGPAPEEGPVPDEGLITAEGLATVEGTVEGPVEGTAAVGGGTNGSDPVPAGAEGVVPADGTGAQPDDIHDDVGGIGGIGGIGGDRVAGGSGGSVAAGKRTETVYELGEWLPEQRAELAMLLDREGIDHSWDTENLVVTSDREGDVEAVLDRIEAVDDPDDDEEATYRALEELFAATDRLVGAPADVTRGKDVVRAVVVADGPTPVGLDDAQWWQIRQRARILADSIEHRAQTDVVLGEARTLRDLLRDLV